MNGLLSVMVSLQSLINALHHLRFVSHTYKKQHIQYETIHSYRYKELFMVSP